MDFFEVLVERRRLTIEELAAEMQLSQRHVKRFLYAAQARGFAEIVGQEEVYLPDGNEKRGVSRNVWGPGRRLDL
jgi:hypothetical protein